MRGAKKISKKLIGLFVALTLLAALIPQGLSPKKVKAASTYTAYVNVSDAVRVRTGAGLGYKEVYDSKGYMAFVYSNEPVTVYSTTMNGSELWYYIGFNFNGEDLKGYLRSDFIHDYTGTYDEAYAASLKKLGFPDSYIPSLCYLHSKHSNWVFTPQFTGTGTSLSTSLDWATALANEQKTGTNLIQKYDGLMHAWMSYTKGYDPLTDTHTSYDSGNFVQASDDAIAFYLDPRNMLNEKLIFGFVNLGYDAKNQTAAGVKSIVKNSFMRGALTDNPNMTYVDTFMAAAKKTGCSPYLLAAKILIEQGSHPEIIVPDTNMNRLPGNISGHLVGGDGTVYDGYYNYYNIGAYAANGRGAQENGIRFAATVPTGVNTYERPWNSVYKSIVGGAIFIARDYINQGQDTIYLEKYDVVGEGLYSHQYCTAINWVEGQAYAMANAYSSVTSTIDFKIPVYQNMPDTFCQKPDRWGNPNNYLKALKVTGCTLSPTFSYTKKTYSSVVASTVESVTISATAACSTAKVTGTGKKTLAYGDNTFKVVVTAGNGDKRTYTIGIYREKPAETPTVTPTPSTVTPTVTPAGGNTVTPTVTPATTLSVKSTKYTVSKSNIVALAPETTVATFLKNMTITGATSKSVTKSDGKTALKNTDIISNGCKLIVDSKSYTLIVNGDPSSDGKVGAKDLLMVKKQLIGAGDMKANEVLAACVSGATKPGAKDLLMIKKHLIGITALKER